MAKTSNSTAVLRTRMSVFISILVWGACLFLLGDAVLARGASALWSYGPIIFAISALTWVFMFGPNVKVKADGTEINNIFHTYRAKYAAIEKVNIGAMISILVKTLSGTTRRVTAWNAPGLKKDNFSDKITSHNGIAPSASHRAAGASSGAVPRLSAEARLERDQRAAESYVLYERWEQYLNSGEYSANSEEVLEISYNWLHIGLVVASVVLVALKIGLS